MKIKQAVNTLTKAIREDKALRISYQANIAMAFKDEYTKLVRLYGHNEANNRIHDIANNAANEFLRQWCNDRSLERLD